MRSARHNRCITLQHSTYNRKFMLKVKKFENIRNTRNDSNFSLGSQKHILYIVHISVVRFKKFLDVT